jgi:hypothetical protein
MYFYLFQSISNSVGYKMSTEVLIVKNINKKFVVKHKTRIFDLSFSSPWFGKAHNCLFEQICKQREI